MALYYKKNHSYLYKEYGCVKGFNPRLMNRLMDKELVTHTTYRNLEPPFLPLVTTNPVMYSPNIDGTRAKIAFGRWALPKLKRQIKHSDIFEVMQALNSIYDLVHDPEKVVQAVGIGLVESLTEMMLHEKDFVREKVCLILYTMAGLEIGRRTIVKRYKMLKNLALLLEDDVDAVRFKAQMLAEMISLSPTASEALNTADYLILLLRLIGGDPKTANDDIVIYHLSTMKMLLQRDIKEFALQHNAMNVMLSKLESTNDKIKMLALDCIAILCHHSSGREEAAQKELGLTLCKALYHPSMEVRIKVAGALAFATIQSDTRSALCKPCTVDILVEILENFHSSEGQFMAMKVLSNLAEDPRGKALVKGMKSRIKQAYTGKDEEVERHRKMLLNALKRK